MALTLYIGSKQIESNIVKLNDVWFQNHIKEIKYGKTEKAIVEYIDNVKYAKDGKFKSKFIKDTLIDSLELSTGCKTALNIFTFPEKVFNLAECGNNALQLIMHMKKGKAYIDYRFMTDKFDNEIIVYVNNKKYTINTNIELDKLMEGYFNAKDNY